MSDACADECNTCGKRIPRDTCRECIDAWAEYKAEMDSNYWNENEGDE